MDAKQACDKLNGFNFQNRYLVGKSGGFFFSVLFSAAIESSVMLKQGRCSSISPARENGPFERGPRREAREFRASEAAARDRIISPVWFVLFRIFPL